MAYQAIGLGSSANDGTGDTLRVGGDKVNDNFVEIYTALGAGSTTALKIITTGASNGDGLIFNSSNSRFEPTAIQATTFTTLTAEGSSDDSFETVIGVVDPTADRAINFPNATGTVITTGNLSDVVFGASLSFEGSTADSFETTLAATDPTADRTITLPNLTGTVSLTTATETLTNKTLTSPTLNSPAINSPTIIFEGSTADSFETTIAVTDPTADRTITLPNATDTLVGKATTDTLTNKTLTTPTIAQINHASGTITLDASTDINLDAGGGDIFLKDDSTTFGSLTNTGGNLIIKSGTTTAMTMSGANVTIAGNLTVSGSTTTVDSSTVNLQTGFIFEGSTADSFETTLTATDPTADRTITLPNLTGTVSLITATETLTNKTLTSPAINSPTIIFEGSTADSFETTIAVTDPTADRTLTLPDKSGTIAVTADIVSSPGIDDQSSSNDDQLTILDTAIVINEDSDDLDFRVEGNSNTHQFFVDGGLAMCMIDQQGAPGTRALPGGESSGLQVKGNSASSSRILASRHSADANGAALTLYKSRNTSAGSFTIVNDNDILGELSFFGDDGTDAVSEGARIFARVEGTPGANDLPTEIVFSTSPDGSNAVTERLRISNAGHLLPAADDTYDLGSSSLQFRDVYTGDLNLNNTKHRVNEVDGTSGSWTIQEGDDNLYILNRLNGKKYKFNLTEVE